MNEWVICIHFFFIAQFFFSLWKKWMFRFVLECCCIPKTEYKEQVLNSSFYRSTPIMIDLTTSWHCIALLLLLFDMNVWNNIIHNHHHRCIFICNVFIIYCLLELHLHVEYATGGKKKKEWNTFKRNDSWYTCTQLQILWHVGFFIWAINKWHKMYAPFVLAVVVVVVGCCCLNCCCFSCNRS